MEFPIVPSLLEELTKELKKDGHEGPHLIATVVVGIKGVEMSKELKKGGTHLVCYNFTHHYHYGDGGGSAGGDVVGAGASSVSGDLPVSLLLPAVEGGNE